jgi:hypothetical protein
MVKVRHGEGLATHGTASCYRCSRLWPTSSGSFRSTFVVTAVARETILRLGIWRNEAIT